jgi:hypothetical protein
MTPHLELTSRLSEPLVSDTTLVLPSTSTSASTIPSLFNTIEMKNMNQSTAIAASSTSSTSLSSSTPLHLVTKSLRPPITPHRLHPFLRRPPLIHYPWLSSHRHLLYQPRPRLIQGNVFNPLDLAACHKRYDRLYLKQREAIHIVHGQTKSKRVMRNWIGKLQVNESLYGLSLSLVGARNRTLKRLSRIVLKVRSERTLLGFDQSSLLNSTCISTVTHVIYAVFSLVHRRIYVGQTTKSAYERFKQHVSCSNSFIRNKKNSNKTDWYKDQTRSLYADLNDQAFGSRSYYTFPLEVIPELNRLDLNKVQITSMLLDRESFWMHHLHTFVAFGYNIAGIGTNTNDRLSLYKSIHKRPTRRRLLEWNPILSQRHKRPLLFPRRIVQSINSIPVMNRFALLDYDELKENIIPVELKSDIELNLRQPVNMTHEVNSIIPSSIPVPSQPHSSSSTAHVPRIPLASLDIAKRRRVQPKAHAHEFFIPTQDIIHSPIIPPSIPSDDGGVRPMDIDSVNSTDSNQLISQSIQLEEKNDMDLDLSHEHKTMDSDHVPTVSHAVNESIPSLSLRMTRSRSKIQTASVATSIPSSASIQPSPQPLIPLPSIAPSIPDRLPSLPRLRRTHNWRPFKIIDEKGSRGIRGNKYLVVGQNYILSRAKWIPHRFFKSDLTTYRSLLLDWYDRKRLLRRSEWSNLYLYYDLKSSSIKDESDSSYQPKYKRGCEPLISSSTSIGSLSLNITDSSASASAASPASPCTPSLVNSSHSATISTSASTMSVHSTDDIKLIWSRPVAFQGTRYFGSRDYHRRIHFIVKMIDCGKLNEIQWWTYSYRVLTRLKQFLLLECDRTIITSNHREIILRSINSSMFHRPTTRLKEVDKNLSQTRFIKLEWTSTMLRHANLRSIIIEHLNYLPNQCMGQVNNIMIAKRLLQPISKRIFNYAKVARSVNPTPKRSTSLGRSAAFPSLYDEDTSLPCTFCSKMDVEFRPNQGCVTTGNLDVLLSTHLISALLSSLDAAKHLKRLFEFGPRFRCFLKANPMDSLTVALDSFIKTLSSEFALPVSAFNLFKFEVLLKSKSNLKNHYQRKLDPLLSDRIPFTSGALHYLKQLQTHFVFVPVDKAANNISIICRSHYIRILCKELSDVNGAYRSITSRSVEDVLADHTSRLSSQYLISQSTINQLKKDASLGDTASLPYLYWTPKLHKNPIGSRFIAGSAACTTAHLSKVLSSALHLVSAALRMKDDSLLSSTGVRRYFIVNSHEQVTGFLRNWNRNSCPSSDRRIRSGDFSTLYTTIPHDDLVDKIGQVIDEAFTYMKSRDTSDQDLVLKVENSPNFVKMNSSWCAVPRSSSRIHGNDLPTQFHSKESHSYSSAALKDSIKFLIDNVYIQNGDSLKRQILGMPMGTNCAPVLANLYLYWYESKFIDRLFRDKGLFAAQSFHMTFRYIDDVLSVDNPFWITYSNLSYEEGGLYPKALTLNDTTLSDGNSVHYVGTTISNVILRSSSHSDANSIVKPKLCIDVFDKRKEFPFVVRLYPTMKSLIPTTIPYGVFMGQLYRYHSICSESNTFLLHAIRIGKVLIERGCEFKKLQTCFKSFLSKHYSHGLRSHTRKLGCEVLLKYPFMDHFTMLRDFRLEMTRGTRT